MSAPKEEEPTPPASRGFSSKLVLAVAGANLVATAGLATLVVVRGQAPAPATASAEGHGEGGEQAEKKEGEHAEKKEGGHAEKKEGAPAEGEKKEGEHAEKKEGEDKGGEKAATASSGETPASTARLDDIVIHLRNPEVDRYARLTIDVEMSRPVDLKQLEDNVPRVRDAIIVALSAYTFEELRGPEGLARMKAVLRDAIDKVVPGDVVAVYVSTFLVQ
jgi:flagellar basal body-associated protein FliL